MLLLLVCLLLVLHPLKPLELVDSVAVVLPQLSHVPLVLLQPQPVVDGPGLLIQMQPASRRPLLLQKKVPPAHCLVLVVAALDVNLIPKREIQVVLDPARGLEAEHRDLECVLG